MPAIMPFKVERPRRHFVATIKFLVNPAPVSKGRVMRSAQCVQGCVAREGTGGSVGARLLPPASSCAGAFGPRGTQWGTSYNKRPLYAAKSETCTRPVIPTLRYEPTDYLYTA